MIKLVILTSLAALAVVRANDPLPEALFTVESGGFAAAAAAPDVSNIPSDALEQGF
jgi:hypothetical protein